MGLVSSSHDTSIFRKTLSIPCPLPITSMILMSPQKQNSLLQICKALTTQIRSFGTVLADTDCKYVGKGPMYLPDVCVAIASIIHHPLHQGQQSDSPKFCMNVGRVLLANNYQRPVTRAGCRSVQPPPSWLSKDISWPIKRALLPLVPNTCAQIVQSVLIELWSGNKHR